MMKTIFSVLFLTFTIFCNTYSQSWSPLGNGMNNRVFSHTTFNNELITGGTFSTAWVVRASRIAICYSPLGIKIINNIPKQFILKQNFPNPFNPATKIQFALQHKIFTNLVVYDNLVPEISPLFSENLYAGSYELNFDGSKLSSGIYLYKIETPEFTAVKKMILIK